MKNIDGKILYIGKAKNIRSRLRTYFSGTGDGRLSVQIFLPMVERIETLVCSNEKEAFLLENILIKKHKPSYNIRLKDDKTYISLCIDVSRKFPRLKWVRRRKRNKALYFGPFASSSAVRKTVRFLEKTFPIRTCPDTIMRNRTRPCIRHQIGRCLAPCCLDVSEKNYRKLIDGIILYLKGNMQELIRRLEDQMRKYSHAMRYEKAAEMRDRILAIRETTKKQAVANIRVGDMDVIGHYLAEGKCCMVAALYRLGVLNDTRTFFFNIKDRDISEIYYAFIGQFYGKESSIPQELLVGAEPSDLPLLEETLSDLRKASVRIHLPQRGKKTDLLKLAMANAEENLSRKLEGERDLSLVIQSLQRKLHLPQEPVHIEGFDISNIQGRLAVGSMVCFMDGKPENSMYRRFQIKSVTGSDDFAMMYEVIKRRYSRVLEEKKPLPSLILIDGGKGQLNAALRALRELNLENMGIIGLAKSRLKENKKKGGKRIQTPERIFLPGRKNPIILKPGSPSLYLIQQVRDEAHRFAITYHKKRRMKALRGSILDQIQGVGPSRKKALLRHFKSIISIKKASIEEINQVTSVSESAAKSVYDFFHDDTEFTME